MNRESTPEASLLPSKPNTRPEQDQSEHSGHPEGTGFVKTAALENPVLLTQGSNPNDGQRSATAHWHSAFCDWVAISGLMIFCLFPHGVAMGWHSTPLWGFGFRGSPDSRPQPNTMVRNPHLQAPTVRHNTSLGQRPRKLSRNPHRALKERPNPFMPQIPSTCTPNAPLTPNDPHAKILVFKQR